MVEKILRNCVVCGANDYEEKFSFTMDFLVNVRGHQREKLLSTEWHDGESSTIVKCNKCGCNYIRDVFITEKAEIDRRYESYTNDDWYERHLEREASNNTIAFFKDRDLQNNAVRMIVLLALKEQNRGVKILDFGAGGADTSNFARAMGVNDVVAYDPVYSPNEKIKFDRCNFPGIHCTNKIEELLDLGPFDAVIFQSSVEHVVDPRGELQTIYDLMSNGGYLYVNNPVMPLDRELNELQSAKRIKKSDRISYYRPEHLNYMLPHHFEAMLKGIGFIITPMVYFPPIPFCRSMLRPYILRKVKYLIRYLSNIFHVPYARQFYIVQKP